MRFSIPGCRLWLCGGKACFCRLAVRFPGHPFVLGEKVILSFRYLCHRPFAHALTASRATLAQLVADTLRSAIRSGAVLSGERLIDSCRFVALGLRAFDEALHLVHKAFFLTRGRDPVQSRRPGRSLIRSSV